MHLANEELVSLANTYGTPLYVYNGDLIEQRYKELYSYIPYAKLKILYAMKANFNPQILKLLEGCGASIDAVSPGDVLMARKMGFSPERILYTANNITDEEMHRVHELGCLFNAGSLSRLEKFGKAFPGSDVCIRFNPAVVAGAYAKIQTGGDLTKFGVLLDDLEAAKKIVSQHKLRVVGLHKHTGSGINEREKFLQAMQNLIAIAKPEHFPDLKFVDFGGGLGVPYHPEEVRIDYEIFGSEMVEEFYSVNTAYGRELEMYFEPGKYIVAESGYLVVEVNTLKDNHGRLIAGTNSGFPQLIRPMFYGSYHHIVNLSNPDGPTKPYDICGNICETGDRFAEQREIPEVREGDYLALQNAGAYCYAMAGIYNLRALPAEVLVKDGKPTLARRRLSDEELIDSILAEAY